MKEGEGEAKNWDSMAFISPDLPAPLCPQIRPAGPSRVGGPCENLTWGLALP